jgi:hypothetical protein
MNVLQYHLPKTAGRSVGLWLVKSFGEHTLECGRRTDGPKEWFDAFLEARYPIEDEGELQVLVGHGAFPQLANALGWDKWRTVTTIRHPAERLRSLYKHYERRRVIRRMPPLAPFEEWLVSNWINSCHCLFCLYEGDSYINKSKHRSNPITKFYASRELAENDLSLNMAKRQLELCDIYHMDDVRVLVDVISSDLGVPVENYRPVNVHGEGEKVTDEHRRIVEREHPEDVELYEWAKDRCVGGGR